MEYCPFDLTRLMDMNLWDLEMPTSYTKEYKLQNADELLKSQDIHGSYFSFSSSSILDSPATFPLPIPMARYYFQQLLDGLLYLSSQLIIHHGTTLYMFWPFIHVTDMNACYRHQANKFTHRS